MMIETMELTARPRYLHDCKTCIFLGGVLFEEQHYDLYYCPQNGLPTVIGRFSDDGPAYVSGHGNPHPVLVEATKRATIKGLDLD